MRRIAFILAVMLVWLSAGCTSNDREFVRNHIVLLEKPQEQNLPPAYSSSLISP